MAMRPSRCARARSDGSVFELSVADGGRPIPEAKRAQLFQPFTRGAERTDVPSGLELGLSIAAEIAHAHGGSLQVTSDEREPRFVFRMPLA